LLVIVVRHDVIHSALSFLLSPSTYSPFFSSLLPRPPRPTLFPYTTLFRSTPPLAVPASTPTPQGAGWPRTPTTSRPPRRRRRRGDRKSTRLNSSHVSISYAVFCLKKKSKNSALQEATAC